MPRTRALYSVVQYVPDGARAEGANAGVVLFVPESGRIVFRTSPSLARVKKFFSPDKVEFEWIEGAVKTLEARLKKAQGEFKSEEEFSQFVAARADAVRLTTPKLVVLTEVEPKLNELYAELVGDEAARARAAKGVTLPPRVAEVFGRLEAAKKVWRPGTVTVPTTRRKLPVSVAYQNGKTNYVRAESLAKCSRLETRLESLGFNGQMIARHPIDDMPGQLVILSSDPDADPETEDRFGKALEEVAVRLVPFSKAEEFAAEVEETAH